MHAWALGYFHSLISTQTFWRVLTASVDSCAEIMSGALIISAQLSTDGITKSGRVWRKVPESDAQSVRLTLTHLQRPSTAIYTLPNSQFVKLANETQVYKGAGWVPICLFFPQEEENGKTDLYQLFSQFIIQLINN